MIRLLHSIRRDRRGQAIVEMALVLPIFILLVMGIIDFGRLYNAQISITHASREGAREAAVGTIDSQVFTLNKGAATCLKTDLVMVSIKPDPSGRRKGDPIIVSVSYRLELITPVIGAMLGGTRDLSVSTMMRLE
ncbi:MAG: TadE/TadG family type IV pilus assembly protein [Bacillota bacterium]